MNRNNAVKALEILKSEFKKWKAPVVYMLKQHKNNPFRVLVCGVLSTRTKDELTYKVCEKFFKVVKKPQDLNDLSVEDIEKLIYPVGFYRMKAKYLKQIGEILTEKYKGKVPDSLQELLKLPGVGRKVANLVLSKGYGKPAIVVDIHVHRIVNRWGLLKTKKPEETEKELMNVIPKKYWKEINYLLVAFGQTICTPQKPKCEKCPIEKLCSKFI